VASYKAAHTGFQRQVSWFPHYPSPEELWRSLPDLGSGRCPVIHEAALALLEVDNPETASLDMASQPTEEGHFLY
jgi:hypothetical protein